MMVQKKPRPEAEALALEMLAQVNLSHRLGHFPMQLSGGESQRAAIARTLAMTPQMLLLDEITSNLDPEHVGEIHRTVRDLADSGMTLVLVSHDLFFVERICDRVAFLDRGKIVETGPAGRVLLNPREPRTKQFLARVMGR